jgi:hypothetical protein
MDYMNTRDIEARLCVIKGLAFDKGANSIDPVWRYRGNDDDVFYLFLQKQKIGAELQIYLEERTYHRRLFRGPNTNDMKK